MSAKAFFVVSVIVIFLVPFAHSGIVIPSICRDTYHESFQCDGIVVHCVVYCDGFQDCLDGYDESHCDPPPSAEQPDPGCKGDSCNNDEDDNDNDGDSWWTRTKKWALSLLGCACAVALFVSLIYFKRNRLPALTSWRNVHVYRTRESVSEDVESVLQDTETSSPQEKRESEQPIQQEFSYSCL